MRYGLPFWNSRISAILERTSAIWRFVTTGFSAGSVSRPGSMGWLAACALFRDLKGMGGTRCMVCVSCICIMSQLLSSACAGQISADYLFFLTLKKMADEFVYKGH